MHLPNHFSVKRACTCAFLFIVILCTNFVLCQPQFEKKEYFFKWFKPLCNEFGNGLINKSRSLAATKKLQQIYGIKAFSISKLHPEDILNNASNNIQAVLSSAEDAVKIISEKAETLNRDTYGHGKVDKSIFTSDKVRFYDKKPDQVSATASEVYDDRNNDTMFYYNSKCKCGYQLPEDLNSSVCYSPKNAFYSHKSFNGLKVSFDFSAIHIPVDVYNAGPDVLRDIVWTQELEATLKSLYCNSSSSVPSYKWSYISTLNGVLRYFPARPWSVPCGKVDLYDSRSIHWFVQSMTSPKEVVIMIDTSGSVIGLTLNLIRVSVDHVMNSLTVNDYFNVILFNKNASFLNPSCSGLLPANYINKEMVLSRLKEIVVQNAADFNNGFDFAFEVLNGKHSNTSNGPRTNCNPVILLFTDGGVDYPYKSLDQWNEDHKTRIFTFSVGKHFSSTHELKNIACNNEGWYASIPSDSATHFQTMKYLVKLSKPLAAAGVTTSKWSLPYQDHLGLNTVLTVSRPFFDKYSVRTDSGHHQHVIQVAGIIGADVRYADVKKSMDTNQWGAATYMFGTDNNGYLFYHPQLKNGRLNSPVILDVADVELANISLIRRNMIDRIVDKGVLEKLVVSEDRQHVTNTEYDYYYKPLSQSVFSVAFAFPSFNSHRLTAETIDSTVEDILSTSHEIFSAAYGLKYSSRFRSSSICSESEMKENDTLPSMFDFRDSESVKKAWDKLDPNHLRELLFHGNVTSKLASHWPRTAHAGLLASFVATDTSPSVVRIKSYDDDLKQGIESALSDPPSKDYFLRPLLTLDANQVFFTLSDFSSSDPPTTEPRSSSVYDRNTNSYQSLVNSVQSSRKHVIISEIVSVGTGESIARPAVSGVVMRREYVKEVLFNTTRKQCDSESGSIDCDCDDMSRLCVLLDDGGLMLASNQNENNVGKFFGLVDGELMKSLVRDGLYVSNDIDDHQVVCEKDDDEGNSARSSFFTPTITAVLKSGWWLTTTMLITLQNIFTIFLTAINGVLSDFASISIPFTNDETLYPNTNAEKVHCIIRTKVFSFGPSSYSVNITQPKNRSYVAGRVENTNLIIVIASFNETDSSIAYPASQLSAEVTNERKCPSGRYRKKPPGQCFNVTYAKSKPELNGNADCGASQLPTSPTLLFSLLILMYSATWLIR